MNEASAIRLHPRLVVCIVPAEREQRLKNVLHELQLPVLHQCRGQGTAPSELLDLFGLGGTARTLIAALLPRQQASQTFAALSRRMAFRERGGGIGFSVPVTGAQEHVLSMLNREPSENSANHTEREEPTMKEQAAHAVIWVSVERGFSEEVIRAAREAGATGGTILRGSRSCEEEAAAFLGVPRQEEQDFIMILTTREKKTSIMGAVSRACGLSSAAHGMIVSLPVEEVCGIG